MENQIRELISEVLASKTLELKSLSLKNSSKPESTMPNPFLNQLPYIFTGVVESIFLNEKKMKKVREYGCGLIINSNKVLVSSKNLIKEVGQDETKEDYKLCAISFELINISVKYRKALPVRFRADNYYCPMEIESFDSNDEAERIAFGWGIISLDYPVGDIVKFIVDSEAESRRELSKFSYVRCSKSVDDEDLVNLMFLECRRVETKALPDTNDSIETYEFVKNSYEIKYDDRMMFLTKEGIIEDNVLPGPILAYDNRHYYLVGLNTTNIFEDQAEEEVESVSRVALRFNDKIIGKLRENSPNLKNSEFIFSGQIYGFILAHIKDKEVFYSLFDNECHYLYKLRLKMLNELPLSSDEKKAIDEIDSNTFKMLLSFIWLNLGDIKSFRIANIAIDSVGMGILTEVIKNTDDIEEISMTHCDLSTEALKVFCKGIFDSGISRIIFSKVNKIDLSFNRFDSKAMKYFKHIVADCALLEEFALTGNYFNRQAMRYLISALKGKNKLRILNLELNCISESGAVYLRDALSETTSLIEVNLAFNNIGDEGLISFSKILKKQKDLAYLNLSHNDLGESSAYYLKEILGKCKKIRQLNVTKNDLNDKGIEGIAEGIDGNEALEILNVSYNKVTAKGYQTLSEGLKYCASLRELSLYGNELKDEGMQFVKLTLTYNKNLQILNLGANQIGDEGLENFIMGITDAENLQEFNIHNNNLTELGCQILLELLLELQGIQKINIEKNNQNFRQEGYDLRKIKQSVNILY